jgi:hypothetical protein
LGGGASYSIEEMRVILDTWDTNATPSSGEEVR